jgi:hypothetical protein
MSRKQVASHCASTVVIRPNTYSWSCRRRALCVRCHWYVHTSVRDSRHKRQHAIVWPDSKCRAHSSMCTRLPRPQCTCRRRTCIAHVSTVRLFGLDAVCEGASALYHPSCCPRRRSAANDAMRYFRIKNWNTRTIFCNGPAPRAMLALNGFKLHNVTAGKTICSNVNCNMH